jgi:hypothetical protein
MIDRPYKNASMSYLYGELENTDEKLANPYLTGFARGCVGDPALPCDDVTIPGYTKTGTMYLGTSLSGKLIFFSDTGTYPTLTNYYENNNTIAMTYNSSLKERLKIVIDYENPDPDFSTDMNFVISLYDGLRYSLFTSRWFMGNNTSRARNKLLSN